MYYFLNVEKQVFYKPPWDIGDGTVQHVRIVSYEDTALFILTNFQYLVTCCAFLVAYPFRKPFYTNPLFMVSVVSIFIVNALFLALPTSSWLCTFFEVQKLTGDLSYKYNLLVGVAINSMLTFLAEKVIAVHLTKYFDRRGQASKTRRLDARMERVQQLVDKN